ncbi:MAG: 2-hydroxychromene-2-carboxylate isomerase [Burkholderiales bacterium]|jgi:2-hydroxychromene-2-carboxylate isomerase
MSRPAVQFLFDFGSPNAYLSHKVLPDLEARTGATVEYVPILLGGLFKLANNRSPMEAFKDIPTKRAYDRHDMARFVARHGLDRFRMNPHFPVNTLKIMRGAVAARRLGVFERYVDAMFAAMWEDGRNMDDVPTIVATLTDAGLDAAALLEASQLPEVKEALLRSTEQAYARGAFGSPTFFVGDEMWFGKERLRDVEDEIVRTRAG